MGLDSIELIVEFENYFDLQIPDSEAVKMETIQSVVDYVSAHIKFNKTNIDAKSFVANKLKKAFSLVGEKLPDFNQNIFKVIPFDELNKWKTISIETGFEIPEVNNTIVGKFFDRFFKSETKKYHEIDVNRFLELICALNYTSVIQKGNFNNKSEILFAVMGITIDKTGVSPSEVFAYSSFTKDLGVD